MTNLEIIKKGLRRRYRKELRFKIYGLSAIILSVSFLVVLLVSIFSNAIPAFTLHYVKLDIDFNANDLGIVDIKDMNQVHNAQYQVIINKSLYKIFPDLKKRNQKKSLRSIISSGAKYSLRDMLIDDTSLLNTTKQVWILLDDDIDVLLKEINNSNNLANNSRINDLQLYVINELNKKNRIDRKFNFNFFTSNDSRNPEQAGIKGAIVGSLFTILVTFVLSFPIAVITAVFLEEFAPQDNKWVNLIEININNLAAVPSIVFGILGLAVYINIFGIPRSSPLVGGLVLFLMTLPTIIIASRAAIKSVPSSIKEAALSIGASKMQMVTQQVVPLAMPGILTGTIIGMAGALGETAPLLMIGMVAFVIDTPSSIFDPSAALSVQVFLWADSPERSFVALTSAAIVVLLVFLLLMNFIAIILRKKFEKRW